MSIATQLPSQDFVMAAAQAVAAPGARAWLLAPDGKALAKVSIEEAASAGVAFMVDLRPEVLVIDSDADAMPDWPIVRGRLLTAVPAACGVVRWASGRPGHEHCVIVFPPGTRASEWREAERLGVPANLCRHDGMDVRPPLSPHRQGLHVRLLEPLEHGAALEVLRRGAVYRPDVIAVMPQMSQRTERLLREGGDTRSGRSSVATGVALCFINDGLDFDQYVTHMLNPVNRGGAKLRETREQRGLAAMITDAQGKWTAAQARYAGSPKIAGPDDARRFLARVRAAADAAPWPAASGASDLAVLLAMVAIGSGVGTINVRAGQRRLAESSGLATNTVRLALGRLVRQGWLVRESHGVHLADTYRVTLKHPLLDTDTFSSPRETDVSVSGHSDSWFDAFHSRALGRGASEVLRRGLTAEWSTTRDIAERVHRRPATVRPLLIRLISSPCPLAERDGRLWRAAGYCDDDLRSIAEHHGTSGVTAAKRARYLNERQAHHDRLEAFLAS